MSGPDPLLQFTDVGHVVEQARVLDRISFSVDPGQRLAIVGGNGDGKSTIARLALGLAAPASGVVRLFGEAISDISAQQRRRVLGKVGLVLQGGSLLNDLTVEDNLRLATGGTRSAGIARSQARLDRLLIGFGLENSRRRMARELSASERGKVELARSLLRDPDLLVLDDPFQGADEEAAADLEGLLAKALRRRPVAMLLLTHNAGLAERLTQSVLRLKNGRLH